MIFPAKDRSQGIRIRRGIVAVLCISTGVGIKRIAVELGGADRSLSHSPDRNAQGSVPHQRSGTSFFTG